MRHGHNEESARAAGTIQNSFIDLRINHFNDHLHNIPRREKLTAIATEICAHDFLVGFAFDVNFGIEQAVSLQLADDICEAPRAEFNFVIGIENFSMTFLNSLKDFSDSLLNGQLSVGVRTLLRCRIKLKRIRNITLILNFAENNLEQFKERRLLLHAIIHINVIMASLENE